MDKYARFIVYWNGNIVDGSNGPQYDIPPIGKVKVKTDANFEQFKALMYRRIGVDQNNYEVEILHRHAQYMTHGVVYMLIPVVDDESLEDLMAMAIELGSRLIQEIFLKTTRRSSITQRLDGDVNMSIPNYDS